jgi:hypothetical protein
MEKRAERSGLPASGWFSLIFLEHPDASGVFCIKAKEKAARFGFYSKRLLYKNAIGTAAFV